jgi:hypothetical protein
VIVEADAIVADAEEELLIVTGLCREGLRL